MKLELNHEEVMEALAYSLANNSGIGTNYKAVALDIIKQPKTGLVTASLDLEKVTKEHILVPHKPSTSDVAKEAKQVELEPEDTVPDEDAGSVFSV